MALPSYALLRMLQTPGTLTSPELRAALNEISCSLSPSASTPDRGPAELADSILVEDEVRGSANIYFCQLHC